MKTIKALLFVTIMIVTLTGFTHRKFNNNQHRIDDNVVMLDKSVVIYGKNGYVDDTSGPN